MIGPSGWQYAFKFLRLTCVSLAATAVTDPLLPTADADEPIQFRAAAQSAKPSLKYQLYPADDELDQRFYGVAIKAIVKQLEDNHLANKKLDEKSAARWIRNYLQQLDPQKLYFLDSDIREFDRFKPHMTDLAKAGDLSVMELVSTRYQHRAAYAMTCVDEFLNDHHDFDIDETVTKSHTSFATSESELAERWRLQIKYELLVEISNGASMEQAIQFVRPGYDRVANRTKSMDLECRYRIYADSLCQVFDSRSGYYSPAEYRHFIGGLLKPYRIGLSWNWDSGRFRITRVAPGFRDHEAAKLLIDNRLLAIRDKSGELFSLRGMTSTEFSQLIGFGLGRDDWITLELFDDIRQRRFSVKWPRR